MEICMQHINPIQISTVVVTELFVFEVWTWDLENYETLLYVLNNTMTPEHQKFKIQNLTLSKAIQSAT